jgi:hypothetical protein
MLQIIINVFKHNWKTYFYWCLSLFGLHVFSSTLELDNYLNSFLTLKEFGKEQFVATITEVYAGVYAIGVPLILTLLEKKIENYKSNLAREFLVFNPEIIFFVCVTPIFIIYCISILYLNQEKDIHVLILFIMITYSFYRLYRLADFCMAVFTNLNELLSIKVKEKMNEIFKEK